MCRSADSGRWSPYRDCGDGALISLFKMWDTILNAFIGLHVFINLAGYLLLGVVLCAAWAVATFIFDRRSYIIFTPGQIRVCEEIAAGNGPTTPRV